MSEKSFPFNSLNHDRVYTADDFQDYFAQFITDGVFLSADTSCQIFSKDETDMYIKMYPGSAWHSGVGYINSGYIYTEIAPSDSLYDRYDRVVLRCDYFLRSFYMTILEGEPSADPEYPTITRNASAYDLVIADVFVGARRNTILNSDITDRRFDEDLCGICHGVGSSGVSDYRLLTNQPSINGVTLVGDKTGSEVFVVDTYEYLTNTDIESLINGVQ